MNYESTGSMTIQIIAVSPKTLRKLYPFSLLFIGQYKTNVTEKDPSEIPHIGSQKSLECVVEDEGKPTEGTTVRWLYNGLPIRGSARYSGLSERVRIICILLIRPLLWGGGFIC